MSELHIVEQPISRDELKRTASERYGDLEKREMIKWIEYQFRFYEENEITKEQLKEVLILGIENILR